MAETETANPTPEDFFLSLPAKEQFTHTTANIISSVANIYQTNRAVPALLEPHIKFIKDREKDCREFAQKKGQTPDPYRDQCIAFNMWVCEILGRYAAMVKTLEEKHEPE